MAGLKQGQDAPETSEHERTTMALDVYSRLREDIIGAELEPGRKLRTRELCELYGVGLSPLREALNRLLSEGMVQQSAKRGFSVASFSIEELDELVRARQWLNEIGLRESILHGDEKWEEGVVLAFHRLRREPRIVAKEQHDAARNGAWNNAHLAFHLSLIGACRSRWLIEFCQKLFYVSDRYRALSRLKSDPDKRLEEHRQIMEATIDRDADRAVRLLIDHFDATATLVREKLCERGENMPGQNRKK